MKAHEYGSSARPQPAADPTPEQVALAQTLTDLREQTLNTYVLITAPLAEALNRDLANFAEAMRRAVPR